MSREIDMLIAEHVVGWTITPGQIGTRHFEGKHYIAPEDVPEYSTDIAAAWEALEELADMDPLITQYGEDDGSWTWHVDFEGTNDGDDADPLRDRDIAKAICLAALKAKGIKVPGDHGQESPGPQGA